MLTTSLRFGFAILLGATTTGKSLSQSEDTLSKADVARQMKAAATFFVEKVSSHGGYVYYYSTDLKNRWGEGKFTADTVFVQPPGTPTVGMAYLKAYDATGDKYFLDAARKAGDALLYGQLRSGGWTQQIHFVKMPQMGMYRNGKGGSRNYSSLDDGQTQAALTMMMRLDKALNFKDEMIHEATSYALKALLAAQFPNGAFPQVWSGPVADRPILKARYPDYDWRTENRIKNYWDYYTLNDNLASSVADTLIEAHKIYDEEKYVSALKRLGDFLINAQMPDPQPGWCQQYDYEMRPIWARKFEPSAVTGWEAQDVMQTLILISRYTDDPKYLDPIPKALAYYRKSLLDDGRVARYYELKTNRPLYMDRGYKLTYDDRAAPSHYGWKMPAQFDEIEKAYQATKSGSVNNTEPSLKALEQQAREILRDLDDQGRWVSVFDGERLVGQPKFSPMFQYIDSGVFSKNMEALSDYLIAQNRK